MGPIGCVAQGVGEGGRVMQQGITPGPWKARPRSILNDGNQDEIIGLGWSIMGPPEPELGGQFPRAADAYLMAAAPELLAACMMVERLVALAEFPSNALITAGRQLAELGPLLRAVIAKARLPSQKEADP